VKKTIVHNEKADTGETKEEEEEEEEDEEEDKRKRPR
jgi:hypothetical protein